ncbi:MAG: hypothetical protein ABMB14_10820 [Myxococcota bacterium]
MRVPWSPLLIGALFGSACDGLRTWSREAPHVVALDGRAGESVVYRVDVPARSRWLTLQLHDTLPPVGPESGLDVDAVVVSPIRCTTAACVSGLGEGAASGVRPILVPGAIEGNVDPTARLVGTTPGGQLVEPRVATPERLDANREHRWGFVSLGRDGQLLVGFDPPIERGSYVYVAIAGRPVLPGGQSDDALLVPIAGRPVPISLFDTEPPPTSGPWRDCPEPSVRAQRAATGPCAAEAQVRAELGAAATRAAACVRPHRPDLADRLTGTDVAALAVDCYASDTDPGCGVGGPGVIHLDARKLDAAPDACGGPRRTVLAGLVADAVFAHRFEEREAVEGALQTCGSDPVDPVDPTEPHDSAGDRVRSCLATFTGAGPLDLDCDGARETTVETVPDGTVFHAEGPRGSATYRFAANAVRFDHRATDGATTAVEWRDGQVTRTVDADGDGASMTLAFTDVAGQRQWTRSDGDRFTEVLPPELPAGAGGVTIDGIRITGCTDDQAAKVARDFWDGVGTGYFCLKHRGSPLAEELLAMLARAAAVEALTGRPGISVTCRPSTGGPLANFSVTEWQANGRVEMNYFPDVGPSEPQTWFHEMLHGLIPVVHEDHARGIRDQVYACAGYCFSPTNQDCKTCFGPEASCREDGFVASALNWSRGSEDGSWQMSGGHTCMIPFDADEGACLLALATHGTTYCDGVPGFPSTRRTEVEYTGMARASERGDGIDFTVVATTGSSICKGVVEECGSSRAMNADECAWFTTGWWMTTLAVPVGGVLGVRYAIVPKEDGASGTKVLTYQDEKGASETLQLQWDLP